MMPFVMSLAGLLVRVAPLHGEVAAMCAPYRIDADGAMPVMEPHVEVRVTQAMIDAERAMGGPGDWSDAYLETLAVFRAIGERIPVLDRAILHGACIEADGAAYVFTAPSGTGKSTHIRLWRRYLGARVRVVNGDKPIVHVPADGMPVAHATPWAGKERWQTPLAHAPLAGIAVVTRGTVNTCVRMDASDAMEALLAQLYMPSDPVQALATLALADRLLAKVPVYRLTCDISEDAVHAGYTAMTGRPWPADGPDGSHVPSAGAGR